MVRIILSLLLVFAPILASQNAFASLLSCENMANQKMSSAHAQHKESTPLQKASVDYADRCSCDQSDCHISHSVGSVTLLHVTGFSTTFGSTAEKQLLKSFPQLGVVSPPFRPPILS